MSLISKVDAEIKSAMLSRNEGRLRALRSIKSALLLAKSEKGAGDMLTAETELAVLQKQAKQRRESADIYLAQNRKDLASVEQEELAVIEEFLPKQLTQEELKAEVAHIISAIGASSAGDMGKVIGQAVKELGGKADGKAISAMVKQLLNA